jgi:hypothetical protein
VENATCGRLVLCLRNQTYSMPSKIRTEAMLQPVQARSGPHAGQLLKRGRRGRGGVTTLVPDLKPCAQLLEVSSIKHQRCNTD